MLPFKRSRRPELGRLTARIRRGCEISIFAVLVMKWGRFEVEILALRTRHVIDLQLQMYLNGLAIISNGIRNYSKGIVPSACWKLLHM